MRAKKQQRDAWVRRIYGVVAWIQIAATAIENYRLTAGDPRDIVGELEAQRDELDTIIAELKESEGIDDDDENGKRRLRPED